MADYPHIPEPDNIGLDDQPTAPLSTDPGPLPEAPMPNMNRDAPFKQYLIAVGAVGEVSRDKVPLFMHDAGMQFAHAAGLDPLLCVGYVSEAAHQADYLAAAAVWHSHMTEIDHKSFARAMPKLYASLSLLFGTKL